MIKVSSTVVSSYITSCNSQ